MLKWPSAKPDAKHQRRKLVGNRHIVNKKTVMAHEQPSREALVHVVWARRQSRVSQLQLPRVNVAEKH